MTVTMAAGYSTDIESSQENVSFQNLMAPCTVLRDRVPFSQDRMWMSRGATAVTMAVVKSSLKQVASMRPNRYTTKLSTCNSDSNDATRNDQIAAFSTWSSNAVQWREFLVRRRFSGDLFSDVRTFDSSASLGQTTATISSTLSLSTASFYRMGDGHEAALRTRTTNGDEQLQQRQK